MTPREYVCTGEDTGPPSWTDATMMEFRRLIEEELDRNPVALAIWQEQDRRIVAGWAA